MIPLMRQAVDRIALIKEKDPSGEVRNAAAQAVVEINSEISK